MQQEEADRQMKKEEEERKRRAAEVKRRKRILEAAFDGDNDEINTVLKEVRCSDFVQLNLLMYLLHMDLL